MASHRKISVTALEKLMNISRPTLIKHLKENGVYHKFTDLSKSELGALVKSFRNAKPDSGLRYIIGFLRRRGLCVQKRRASSTVHRVDGLGRVLRQRCVITWREYRVSRPHAIWHLDEHHKLILWGIVMHGFIDGYSRTVSFSFTFDIDHWILSGHRIAGKHQQQGHYRARGFLGGHWRVWTAITSAWGS
jgi:hypothetical protein